jgi:hypothetical protein
MEQNPCHLPYVQIHLQPLNGMLMHPTKLTMTAKAIRVLFKHSDRALQPALPTNKKSPQKA